MLLPFLKGVTIWAVLYAFTSRQIFDILSFIGKGYRILKYDINSRGVIFTGQLLPPPSTA
jgi:hypothetical protein